MEHVFVILIILILFSILITRRNKPFPFVLRETENLSLRSTEELLAILRDYKNIPPDETSAILAELKIREYDD